jgi:hypothetical protein
VAAQILEVSFTHAKTLSGLIDQIFDKALIETTFCELYSTLCRSIFEKARPWTSPACHCLLHVCFG